jgi:predicted ATP-binding protein involved in virulence
MKTLVLEIEDNAYQTVLDFIKLLPENRCHILEEPELLSHEQQHIQRCLAQIQQGDYSEFDDWETVKNTL